MASFLSYIPVIGRLVGSGDQHRTINIPPVEVHNLEGNPEKRPRTLKHLLRANHVNHSIIYHNLQFDNHLPHHLCSAYHLGATPQQLYHIYDEDDKFLEPWKDSPSEMGEEDWRDFLGDKRYQRAYINFFDDRLAIKYGWNWKAVLQDYMFKGDEPLVNGLIGGRMYIPVAPSPWPRLTS
jgi:hypothetical protein